MEIPSIISSRRINPTLENRKKACIFPLYNQMARLYPERFQEFVKRSAGIDYNRIFFFNFIKYELFI